MLHSTAKWSFILFCLFALGPAVSTLAFHLRDVDGGPAASLLIGESLSAGLFAGVAALAAALVAGILGAALFSMYTGLGCAGLILAWSGWGLGTIDDFARRTRDSSDLTMLGIEGMIAAILVAGLATLVMKVALSREHAGRLPSQHSVPPRVPSWIGALALRAEENAKPLPAAGAGLILGAIVMGAVVWLAALTPMRGQTLMAVVLGGMAAGLCAQLAASSFRVMLSPIAPLLGVAVLALFGPISAGVLHGSGFLPALFDGTLWPLARPLSLEWGAGALLGIPLGLAWGGSVLDLRAASDD